MAVDILKGFEFPTLSDAQKMFLMEDGAVTLTQRRQIEHSGDNGTITSPYTFVDADAGGLFVLSDRAKYLRLYSTLNNGVLPPIYIREVVDADTLRLNTPKLVSDTGVSWDLLSYKETYPLDLDLVAKSPLWTAEESVALLNFEAVTIEPTGTSVKFRLTDDGITYQYWDGAAWSAATLDAHWSTAADIDANIGTFDFSKQTLGFAAQLLTTDPLAAPVLEYVKLRHRSNVVFHLDLRHSLLKFMEDITPMDWVQVELDDTNTIDLSTVLEVFYDIDNVQGILAVYNIDVDPTVNLYSSYAKPNITLTGNTTGVVKILFTHKPRVVYQAHQDYEFIEENLTPAYAIIAEDEQNRTLLGMSEMASNYEHPSPDQITMVFTLQVSAQKMRTLTTMADALEKAIRRNGAMVLKGTGEYVTLHTDEGFEVRPRQSMADYRVGELRVLSIFVPRYYEESQYYDGYDSLVYEMVPR